MFSRDARNHAGVFDGDSLVMTEVQQVLQHAQRIEQMQDWGRAVWHVWGADQGKPRLVLLHGGSGSWTHWLRNVRHLSARHEVWALDIPGFGDSDLPHDARDADELVPYIDALFQARFGDEALRVVGFSFGGMTAGLIAAHSPQRISQLVLVGVPGLGLFGKDLPMRGMRADMSEQQQREVHRINLGLMMLADPANLDDALIDLQQHNVARDRLRRRRIARTDVLAQAQHRWTCEVHGIWGERDALYAHTLSQVPQVLRGLKSFQVVPNAGHWVPYEAPEAFHQALDAVL
jgi:2-hydroxy-6-oxonona-2,4-dienedioate hydrolase